MLLATAVNIIVIIATHTLVYNAIASNIMLCLMYIILLCINGNVYVSFD